MLRGATCKAAETAGTAVLRIVVSSDSMKNATATSQGSVRLLESEGDGGTRVAVEASGGFMKVQGSGCGEFNHFFERRLASAGCDWVRFCCLGAHSEWMFIRLRPGARIQSI